MLAVLAEAYLVVALAQRTIFCAVTFFFYLVANSAMESFGHGRGTIVQRQRADLLFGFGGAIDPAFSPAITAAAAQARAARAKQGPPPPSSPVTNKSTAALTPGGLDALK